MSDSYQWRRNFIALVEDVFRDLGFSPPAMTHDVEAPLAMEIEVDDIVFEVVHSSRDRPDKILIECHFGQPPVDRATDVLNKVLQVNLSLARAHEPAFGVDMTTGDVIYAFHEPLESMSARELMDAMKQAAVQAKEWRMNYFFDEAAPPNTPTSMQFETLA
ncbi:MAG: CesT family type III secretion system chaperone [Janthinobacterium lividum]